MSEYTQSDHIHMVESRVRPIDCFQAECPCGWRDKFPSRAGAELHLIDHYRSKHRWVEGQELKCGKDAGSRPIDQYDPCPCLLTLGHEGGHACLHTDPSLLRATDDREGRLSDGRK